MAVQPAAPGFERFACQCQHLTEGPQCSACEPLANGRDWKQRVPCSACECNQHSSACSFNSSLANLDLSGYGGVCEACQHNTVLLFARHLIGTLTCTLSRKAKAVAVANRASIEISLSPCNLPMHVLPAAAIPAVASAHQRHVLSMDNVLARPTCLVSRSIARLWYSHVSMVCS